MKKLASSILIVMVAWPFMYTGVSAETVTVPPVNQTDIGQEAVQGEVIVQFKDGNQVDKTVERYDMEAEKAEDDVALVSFDRKDEKLETAIKKLDQDKAVVSVQPNYRYTPANLPNDPYFNQLWGLRNIGQYMTGKSGTASVDINISKAWDMTSKMSLKEVKVAVLDSGIDIDHPDLKNSIYTNMQEANGRPGIDDDANGFVDDVHGWDFFDNASTVDDEIGHGTHVAGTIAAGISNGIGVSGIAPNVKIVPLKFIGTDGGTTFGAIKAIQYAKKMGVQIVNNSWVSRGGFEDDALEQAIRDSGMLFIAAAGNESSNNDTWPAYPASYNVPNMISVAAIDNQGKIATFSNYGKTVDVAAPGYSILSTIPHTGNSEYGYMSGTSMATPHVTGVAALLMGAYPEGNLGDLIDTIEKNGRPLLYNKEMIASGNMIDAAAALDAYTPIDIVRVEELHADDDYVEGEAWRESTIKVTSEHGMSVMGKTDAKGYFKIQLGDISKEKSLNLQAIGEKKQSSIKIVQVQPLPEEKKVVEINASKQTFIDVPSTFWSYGDIEWAVGRGLIKGYPDKTFRPEKSLTEAQLAAVMSQYFNRNIDSVPDEKDWYGKFYTYLKNNQVMLPGHTNKKVIEKPVKRITLAKALAASQGVEGSDKQIIDWMYRTGLTVGRGKYNDKYKDFGGNDLLNRSHISIFFRKMDKMGATNIRGIAN
ncbi:S8 family serine peptidase [Aciduricibacillus chroicocephali]|uniref:S8 family serine peptidase n=1 Tax=Aciduricibacillus chroicocephali TaxID=3054939 RepID=A0ABY9KXI7_9BACI|nr:S8 family serine peptidase [Bacillaceae bacterium 44XB]